MVVVSRMSTGRPNMWHLGDEFKPILITMHEEAGACGF